MCAKPNATEHTINGSQLVCPICKHTKFWTRRTLMNTRGASFMNFDWANKEADNYVCDSCGYVIWFLNP